MFKMEKIVNPVVADLPETPAPKTISEGKIEYAAIWHAVYTRKGYLVDDGWVIRWFDNAEEAAKVDAEARQEAESLYAARQIYTELTVEVTPVELPVDVPIFSAPDHSPQRILTMAGFSEDQYRVREDVGNWYYEGERGYRDPYEGDWVSGSDPKAWLAYKNQEGIWEIGTTGCQNMFEGKNLRGRRGWANAKSVLEEMGASDKIQTIKSILEAEKEKAEADFREKVRGFVEKIKVLPAFICLPRGIQEKVTHDCRGIHDISSIVTELRAEWGFAEKLCCLKGQGKILANWGGYYRVMGRTGNKQFWVIRPDGSERIAEDIKYRKGYRSEGEKFWRVVGQAELAISWSKSGSASHHEFVVDHLPVSGLTPEQIAFVSSLEDKIANDWDGARGFASGLPSPSVGTGWGITGRKEVKAETSVPVFKTVDEEPKGVGNTAMAEALRKAGLLK